jgi:hypothetical protein
MSMKNSTKLIVLSVVLAAVTGAGLVFGIAVLPIAFQSYREAARREECNENLRQIGEALHNYRVPQNRPSPVPSIAGETRLTYDTYSGYFVSNKFEPEAAESFAVIGDQAQFEKLFGVAMVMGDKSHRLPANAFESNMVLGVIKRGHAVWEYKVEGVVVIDSVITLRYSTTSKESDSAEFASPLIVSIPKVKYAAVEFMENNKLVKRIDEKGKNSHD